MRRLTAIAPLAGIAVVLMSCGGATPPNLYATGEQLLGHESYGDAEAFYRRMLQMHPADPKAADGLLQARKGWMDKALRSIRVRRQAGDLEGSLLDFERIVKQAREWGMGVPGGVGPLYEEEAAALGTFLDARLRWYVQGNQLLAGRAWLTARRDAFGDGTAGQQRFADRQAQMDDLGARHCESLWRIAAVRAPWFADFTARYCAGWNVLKSLPKALVDERNGERFKRIDATSSVNGLLPAEADRLSDAIQVALRRTPYFDQDGTATLHLASRGAMVASEQRLEEPLEHAYAMRVPYSTLEEYCEWQQVPVTGTKWVDGRQVVVTENRKECINRTREVQKERIEPQVLRFNGSRVRQNFRIQLEAEATLAERTLRASESGVLDESDVTHEMSRPDIALAPDPMVLTPRAAWLDARFSALAAALAARLSEQWSARYCVPGDGIDLAAEQALRCLAANPEAPPPFVDAWARQVFGIGAEELRKAVP